jgi:hypothetical protein
MPIKNLDATSAEAGEETPTAVPREMSVPIAIAKSAVQLMDHRTLTRDIKLVDFIDERMPPGRKREGIPKSLLYEAKEKFGLSSKSSILRAYNRGKRWKSDAARIGFEIGKRNPRR